MAKSKAAKRTQMSPEIEALRAEKHGQPRDCYDGQWKIHESHSYEVEVMDWLGGGTEMVTCPGKTASTVLR